MPSFVSRRPIKVTVDSRPEEYIEIRAKLGVGASGDLTDAMLSVSGMGSDEAEVKIHAGKYTAALLEAGIVGWRLIGDPDGDIPLDKEGCVPFKRDYISLLDPEDELVDATLQRLVALNPTLGQRRRPNANA